MGSDRFQPDGEANESCRRDTTDNLGANGHSMPSAQAAQGGWFRDTDDGDFDTPWKAGAAEGVKNGPSDSAQHSHNTGTRDSSTEKLLVGAQGRMD